MVSTIECFEFLIFKRLGDFYGAVAAKIENDDSITIMDFSYWFFRFIYDYELF